MMMKHHLFLVVHDSKDGCSIHRIDVASFDPDDGTADDLDSQAEPLPEPVIRVEARDSPMHFVALGTKILALQPSPGGAAPALDTRTMAITAGSQPTLDHDDKNTFCPFVAIGDDRIYGMDMRSGPADLEVLRLGGRCSGGWSWSSVPSPPPFDPLYVKCYAVHPDERTIFYSLCSSKHMDPAYARDHLRYRDDTGATFSLDTETLEWAFRGYWRLPFDDGEAHYDAELDAWVGFDNNAGDGRLCSCDVVPPATGDEDADRRAEAPPTKHCKDRLFRRKGRRRHGGGGLVYMGGSKFCVLECATEKRLTGEEFRQVIKMDARPRLHLYMRTFSLKYSKKGRLRVATCGRRARCYCLPEGTAYYPYGDLMQTIRGLWL